MTRWPLWVFGIFRLFLSLSSEHSLSAAPDPESLSCCSMWSNMKMSGVLLNTFTRKIRLKVTLSFKLYIHVHTSTHSHKHTSVPLPYEIHFTKPDLPFQIHAEPQESLCTCQHFPACCWPVIPNLPPYQCQILKKSSFFFPSGISAYLRRILLAYFELLLLLLF